MKMTGHGIKIGAMAIAAGTVFCAGTMFLWNALLPDLFNLKPIGFWQALGLLVLSRLLFGGFGGRFHGHDSFSRRKFNSKWMHMSEEERNELIKRRANHFGHTGRDFDDKHSDQK